ncbi:MAG: hypothetical protein WC889_13580, partial [Myxococcota bacterium]
MTVSKTLLLLLVAAAGIAGCASDSGLDISLAYGVSQHAASGCLPDQQPCGFDRFGFAQQRP